MLNYDEINRLKRYVSVDPHAIRQYQKRIVGLSWEEVRRKLKGAYLRGTPLDLGARRRIAALFKYKKTAAYYKYGNLIVVVAEKGERYSSAAKKILTCYQYKESKFDPVNIQ